MTSVVMYTFVGTGVPVIVISYPREASAVCPFYIQGQFQGLKA